MPSCRSTSSQSTRVFAPHVILQQNTTRLTMTLSSGQGYTLAAGLTAGDVIRYNPDTLSYVKSQADSEINAEVVGVIEGGITGPFTVVLSGSINYPQEKLTPITNGGDGGIDILFLNDEVAGGLTGTIDVTQSIKIVKPVIQLAKHGEYNGIVVNYIGYKTGSASQAEDAQQFTGSIVFGPPGIASNVYVSLESDQVLDPADNAQIFSFFGTTSGPWLEALTISSGPSLNTSLKTNQAKVYQVKNGITVNNGYVEDIDLVNSILYVRKGGEVSPMDSSLGGIYINGVAYGFSATAVKDFFVPRVNSTAITQNGEALIAYLKITDQANVTLPSDLVANSLTADSLLVVNGIDVKAKLNELEVKINLLNNRVSAF